MENVFDTLVGLTFKRWHKFFYVHIFSRPDYTLKLLIFTKMAFFVPKNVIRDQHFIQLDIKHEKSSQMTRNDIKTMGRV
jgi:hypothetical protein